MDFKVVTAKLPSQRKIRKVHRQVAVILAIPSLVIFVTGLLLQLNGHWSWISPVRIKGSGTIPALGPTQLFEIVKSLPEVQVKSWDDIDRIDIRPKQGTALVRSRNQWDVQIDSRSGKILSSASRQMGLLVSIHEGSWFHPKVPLFVFLPTAVLLLVAWVTGILMLIL